MIVSRSRLQLGIFHLRESLWLGLGPPLTVLGIIGLAAPFFAHSERRQPLAAIAGFALLWYLAHEVTPLKPYPDFARYMVPLVPLLMILGAAFINEWAERYRTGTGQLPLWCCSRKPDLLHATYMHSALTHPGHRARY